jgi:hypothetical protein
MKIWVRLIAVLEIIGGVFGVGFLIWGLSTAPFNPLLLLLVPIAVSIYIFSLVAGVALWRGSTFGRQASIIVQAIQLPKLVSPPLIFIFSFGCDVWIHYLWSAGSASVGFEFKLLAFNQFFVNVRGAPLGLGVSITAAIFLAMLVRYKPDLVSVTYSPPPPPPVGWNDGPGAASR